MGREIGRGIGATKPARLSLAELGGRGLLKVKGQESKVRAPRSLEALALA
jgi:hypothetical protein